MNREAPSSPASGGTASVRAGKCPRGFDAEFLGEAECVLHLQPNEAVAGKRLAAINLQPNYDKGRRRIHGTVSIEYTWTPQTCSPDTKADTLLFGRLEVTVVSADDLLHLDWSLSDQPFCRVIANPHSPGEDGVVKSDCRRVALSQGDHRATFDMLWTKEMTVRSTEISMRKSVAELKYFPNPVVQSVAPKQAKQHPNVCSEEAKATVSALRSSLGELRATVPRLASDISLLRQDLRAILEALSPDRAATDRVARDRAPPDSLAPPDSRTAPKPTELAPAPNRCLEVVPQPPSASLLCAAFQLPDYQVVQVVPGTRDYRAVPGAPGRAVSANSAGRAVSAWLAPPSAVTINTRPEATPRSLSPAPVPKRLGAARAPSAPMPLMSVLPIH